MSHSPGTIEHFEKREGTQSTLSRGLLEAVVEEDDDARVETVQTEPLGASSSDHDDKTIRQGFATGSRERRPWTRRRTCLLQDSTDTGREQRRLHKTRRRDNHYVHICFERCPLTTRHTAKRSGSVTLLQGFGGTASQRPKWTTKHDRSFTVALAKSGL